MNAPYTLHLGDSREVLKTLPDNSVDAIVTDPPYGLSKEPDMAEVLRHWLAGDDYTASGGGFMGKTWDSFVPGPAVWRECMRVLKPGGHLLAFFGSRTYDLGTLAIRLAGFEVRDQIMYLYGSGFPKSMNLDRQRGKTICGCVVTQPYTHDRAESEAQRDLRPVRNTNVPQAVDTPTQRREVLQQSMSEQSASAAERREPPTTEIRCGQSGMEGRRDDASSPRKLRESEVRTISSVGDADGTEGRLCDGAPPDHGGMVRIPADTDGGCSPRRPHAAEQCERQPGAMAGQPKPQAMGAWPICGGCGLPMVPKGLGTALKPAHEPICVARKPLIGTVAANVLEHGTGALNIDACRVSTDEVLRAGSGVIPCRHDENVPRGRSGEASAASRYTDSGGTNFAMTPGPRGGDPSGRWPANVIHDGSDEVLEAFAQYGERGAAAPVHRRNGDKFRNSYGAFAGNIDEAGSTFHSDTGTAARFFYAAKASRTDRNEGIGDGDIPVVGTGATMREREDANWQKRNGNHHPTVKPTDLMAYLCRLVTPPGGVVLDPFMGSGSTGKACMREGFQFIGVDLTPEYVEIARARIAHELAKQIPVPAAPAPQMDLFGETA